MNESYYAHIAGEVSGPFDILQIAQLYNSGQITVETQICRHGEENWKLYAEVFSPPSARLNEKPQIVQAVAQQPSNRSSDLVAGLLALLFGPLGLYYKRRYGLFYLWILVMIGLVFMGQIGLIFFPVWLLIVLHSVMAKPHQE